MTGSVSHKSVPLLRHGILLICLGTAVCALGSFMAKPFGAQLGYTFAGAAIGVCLLIVLVTLGRREMQTIPQRITGVFLAVGALMVCFVAFSAIQTGSFAIPVVGVLACLLGLFWSSWYVSFSFTFPPRSPQAIGLCSLAAANSSLGIILATRTDYGKLSMVVTAGCYMIVLGVQVYLLAAFLYRELVRAKVFDRG